MSSFDPAKITKETSLAKKNNKKTVLATGVFDVLHQEHVNFLNQAKKAGNFLVVGIETDKRVKQIKGNTRPINTQEIRLKNILKIKSVNIAFVLPEKFSNSSDHLKLISYIQPDIIAVSSHTKHQSEKKKIVEKFGGILKIVHQHNPNISTSILTKTK